MEIEMKYAIADEQAASTIWNEIIMSEWADTSTAEKVLMKAVYFDTHDRILAKNDIAFRVRSEGDNAFATLKWGGRSEGGLHERQEINIPVSGEHFFIDPPSDIFNESQIGKDMTGLLDGRSLTNLLETRFLRRRIKLNYEDNVIELAVDTGSIVTDNGDDVICELELELYSGSEESLVGLGAFFVEKYGLKPMDASKFSRGLALLNKQVL